MVLKTKKTNSLRFRAFPQLRIKKNGVFFCSTSIHRIRFCEFKTFVLEDVLYLKNKSNIVIVHNVKDIKIYKGFLYFKGCGKVWIEFDCEKIYKYFCLIIKSKEFDLNPIKRRAVIDMLNSGFDQNCRNMNKFIDIIENVLNISVTKDKITVRKNKFKLKFRLTYKLNNKIRMVNIY